MMHHQGIEILMLTESIADSLRLREAKRFKDPPFGVQAAHTSWVQYLVASISLMLLRPQKESRRKCEQTSGQFNA